MRTLLAAPILALIALDAFAQAARPAPLADAPKPPQIREGASTARPPPSTAIPLEDASGPSPLSERAPQPEVSTRVEGDQTIQEYRIKGRLYMQRVTPRHGRAYVLVDNKGDGTFSRLEQTLDQQVRVPQWVLLEF
jgi:hypothetical protein